MMKNKQRKITKNSSAADNKKFACTLPLNLQKVYVLPADKRNSRTGMVPVRIYLTPDQLAEIVSLKVDLTLFFQDWLADNVNIYQTLLRDDDSEELMVLNEADDNGDKIDADVHK